MPQVLKLMAPGPTPLPDRVRAALARPAVHHRGADFKACLGRVETKLQQVFRTTGEVLLLTSSGTGAMEAAVCNLLSRGDAAVYVNGGKFGERWGQILAAWGCRGIEISVPWGEPVTAGAVRATLAAHPEARAVFVQACETSTATAHPIEAVAAACRELDGQGAGDVLCVVDGITAVGVAPMEMDGWGIDVLISGSQKAFMLPPGLAFVSLSERAWRACDASDLPKFYFDLRAERRGLAHRATAFTPASALVIALEEALEMMLDEGMEPLWRRHARLAAATRAGVVALGMTLLSSAPSAAVTGCVPPPGVDAGALRSGLLDRHAIVVAGGQDHLAGRLLRVGHLGDCHEADVLSVVAALEIELRRLGATVPADTGVAAAAASFAGL